MYARPYHDSAAALLRGDGAWLSSDTAREIGAKVGDELVFVPPVSGG